MRIEELRDDDIGQQGFAVCLQGQEEPEEIVKITYPDYVNRAFDFTIQSIEQIEKSEDKVRSGNIDISAISLWFLSIESYINSILKITCVANKVDFRNHAGKTMEGRISTTLEILGKDKRAFYRSGIFAKLKDYMTFRNEIFHDRTYLKPLQFRNTSFCSIPYMANIVDSMQSAIIAFEIFYAFQHVIPKVDLMPDIFVQKDDSFGFLKYSLVYNEFLSPYFVSVLKKHNLTSGLKLNPIEHRITESVFFDNIRIIGLIKKESPQGKTAIACRSESNLKHESYKKLQDKLNINPCMFKIPNMNR